MKLSEKILNDVELNDCCQEWVKILGLESWQVTCNIACMESKYSGRLQWDLSAKRAHVQLNKPDEYRSEYGDKFNMEYGLLRRLVEVRLAILNKDSNLSSILISQCAIDMANALYKMKHAEKPK